MYIAEVERRSGLSRDVIRYYEGRGLVTPPRRGTNNYRIYNELTLTELAFIQRGKLLGFTLKEIQPAIAHLENPPERCSAFVGSLEAKRVEIEQRIESDRAALAGIKRLMLRFS